MQKGSKRVSSFITDATDYCSTVVCVRPTKLANIVVVVQYSTQHFARHTAPQRTHKTQPDTGESGLSIALAIGSPQLVLVS